MIKHEQYLDICRVIAESSHSKRLKVGCIIVRDNNIISMGYNGTPSGFPNECEDLLGNTLPEVLHAESNAIAKLARSTQWAIGASLYTLVSPCIECAKLIIQAGIKEVYFKEYYRSPDGLNLLGKAKILIQKI